MSNTLLYTKLQSLPDDLRDETLNFLEFLLEKNKKKKQKKHPKTGCMKGMFIMSKDFDEPLEDFKEYM